MRSRRAMRPGRGEDGARSVERSRGTLHSGVGSFPATRRSARRDSSDKPHETSARTPLSRFRCLEMTSLEIQRRYFRYYLGVLNQADILYCEGGEALAQGLELLDEAWSKICHGQEQAARLMERDKEAAWCCDRYAGYGASVLHVRQHPSDQIRWLESAVNAARALEDRVAEAIHLGNLGIALY